MNPFLDRWYERLGPRYIVAIIATAGLLGFAQLAIAIWIEAVYLEASVGQFARELLLFTPIPVAALGVGLFSSAEILRSSYRWLRDGRPQDRVGEVWEQAIRAGYVVINRAMILVAIAIVPGHLLISPPVFDISVSSTLPLILFGEVAAATAWLVLQFLIELTFRPLVRDVASRMASEVEEPPTGWPLRTKAVVTVPVAAFYAAFAAGAFVFQQETPEARIYAALAAAAVVTFVFAGPVAAIASGAILDPVQDLIAAAKRVARGDVSKPVPIVSDDEFGDLARSFNRMQHGLRERESLRKRNEELVGELQASRARIVAASTEARRRVERDLHDGAQQSLMLLNLKLGMAHRQFEEDPEAARGLVEEARADLDQALDELRDLAHGIYPQVLSTDGLPAALKEAGDQAPIPTKLELDGTGRLRPELEAAVYFCCLEALQNAAKHAGQGATASIRLAQRDAVLRFEVADDRVGFDADVAVGSSGLQNMADRIGALGGELRVESRPGAGTRVVGSLPVEG